MMPMRDGIGLNTDVYVPKDQHGPLPFILLRTPYGIDGGARNLTAISRPWPTTATSSCSRTSAAATARRGSSS